MNPASELPALFSRSGPLPTVFPHYRERAGQLDMALAVEKAIATRQHLLVEAGTGIGKTLGYLIPALRSGGRILISTGTKTLQDQLYGRDLPQVIRAINVPVSMALLKGRANYVCHYHLAQALADRGSHKTTRKDLERIERFAQSSLTGDRADCNDVADHSPAWARAVSTRDNCLGSKCPNADVCFLLKARKAAMDADVLVINHHLFFADMAIREGGGQELLPTAQVVIFDEAHQVRDIASDFFSDGVSSTQLRELARDARHEMMLALADMPQVFNLADAVEYKSADLIHALIELPEKMVQDKVIKQAGVMPALSALLHALQDLQKCLESVYERAVGLERILERTEMALLQLELWLNPPLPPHTQKPSADITVGEHKPPQSPYIHWLEHNARQLRLVRTPISIALSMQRQYLALPRSWIFCSATLSLAGDFSLLRRDLGLQRADGDGDGAPTESAYLCEELAVESPFDYPRQSRLYLPAHLPPPSDPEFMEQMLNEILPAIRACRGGVFVLCTSLRSVDWLASALSARLTDRLILAQKTLPRHQLLHEFKLQGDAVLIGSHSFWEGVDFPGPTLSMVIIDKLPFSPPDDPLQRAMGEVLERSGGNTFRDLYLPQAAILLKQGAGRLIRSESDEGVLMICDQRLVSKSYGKSLLRALPPMQRAQSLDEICTFLQALGKRP